MRTVGDHVPLQKLVARRNGVIVGLVLVGESMRGPRRRRALYLQGTRGRLGRISAERGGLLLQREDEANVRRACLRFLGEAVAERRWNR